MRYLPTLERYSEVKIDEAKYSIISLNHNKVHNVQEITTDDIETK